MKIPLRFLQKTRPPQGEYKYVRSLRVFNLLIIGVIAVIILQTGLFLYQNVYQSITRVETIILLKSELGTSGVDFDRLRRVSNAWEKKHASDAPAVLWDPFTATPIVSATGTTPLATGAIPL